jgi:hypothetical protein
MPLYFQDKTYPSSDHELIYLENIMAWWKKKATKRYDKLKAEGRF